MPFIARTEAGDHCHVEGAERSDGWAYACPYCDGKMRVVAGAGTQRRKHFRHRAGDSCYEYDSDESQAPIDAKQQVEYVLLDGEWADAVSLEGTIGSTRPDVTFTAGGTRIGVEVQVSGITERDLRERTAEGLATLWLFHEDTHARQDTSATENDYTRFAPGERAYVDFLGAEGGETVWIHYHRADAAPQWGYGVSDYRRGTDASGRVLGVAVKYELLMTVQAGGDRPNERSRPLWSTLCRAERAWLSFSRLCPRPLEIPGKGGVLAYNG